MINQAEFEEMKVGSAIGMSSEIDAEEIIKGPLPSNLTIVAIGGAGKQLIWQLCNKKYLFQYYIQNRMPLKIFIIDSDKSERFEDEKRHQAILKTIESMGGKGFIKINYIYLPGQASLNSYTTLTDPRIVDTIKNGPFSNRIKLWWLQDESQNIYYDDLKKMDPNVNEDFSGGVHRRRAISKAIFYKLVSENQAILQELVGGSDHVAIVVGLGGGTGSGMYLDVARYIRENSPSSRVWLYAILPSMAEDETEQLNAAIALTELEYTNFIENPFNLIVMTKLPDVYTSAHRRTEELIEFDDAFSSIFLNLLYGFNGDLNPLFNARKRYNSFLFACAHTIRYPIKQLMDTSEKFTKIQDQFRSITSQRVILDKKVAQFLHTNGLTTPGKIMVTDIVNHLNDEFYNTSTIWSDQFVKVFGYRTLLALKQHQKMLGPMGDAPSYEEVVSYIQKMKEFSRPAEYFGTGVDETLEKDVRDSLKSLLDLAELFPLISGIENKAVRDVLIDLLCGNISSPTIEKLKLELTGIDKELQKIDTDYSERLKSIESGQAVVKIEKSDLASFFRDLQQSVNNMVNQFNKPTHEIPSILDKRMIMDTIRIKEEDFSEEFNRVFDDLSRREIAILITEGNETAALAQWKQKYGVSELMNKVNAFSEDTGENFDGLSSLIDRISQYYFYSCAEEWCSKAGFSKRVFSGGKSIDTRRIYFTRQKISLNSYISENAPKWGINFNTIPGPKMVEFRISKEFMTHKVSYDIKEYIDSILKEINYGKILLSGEKEYQERITTLFKENPGNIKLTRPEWNISREDIDSIKHLLELPDPESICNEFNKQITQAYLKKLGYIQISDIVNKKEAALAREYENLQNEYDNNIRLLDQRKQILVSTTDLLREMREGVKDYIALIDTYKGETNALMNIISAHEGELFNRGDYLTIFNQVNQNLLANLLRSKKNRMTALDRTKEGEMELLNLYNEIVRTCESHDSLMDPKKLGLYQNPIEYQGRRCVVDRAALVINCPSKRLQEMIATNTRNLKEVITAKTHLNDPTDAIISTNDLADPWDIGVTFFAGTSFLDNVSIFRLAFKKYHRLAERYFLHHTAFMEQGEYIIRDNLLNVTDAGNLATKEKVAQTFEEERMVKEEIMGLYKKYDLVEVLKKNR